VELTARTALLAALLFLASPWVVFASYLTWGLMLELAYWVKDHATDTTREQIQ